ncbi:MAG: PGPGW domain-containing protein [Pseudomonadota bacterium]|nr:PGPGW domain-containing protein [Pseudomonadota bacterium]
MLSIVHQVLGAVLVIAGAILTPTPIPIGLVLLTIGLALLAPYMPPVQRLVRAIRRKWPNVDASLRRHRDRMPPVIQMTIDRTSPHQPAE